MQTKALRRGPEIGYSRKWLGEGAKGLLGQESEKPLAPVPTGVAPLQSRFRLTTLRSFHFSAPLPGAFVWWIVCGVQISSSQKTCLQMTPFCE